MRTKACPCWYGPVTIHSVPAHCCFRDDLIETPGATPKVACGHKPRKPVTRRERSKRR